MYATSKQLEPEATLQAILRIGDYDKEAWDVKVDGTM